MSDMLSDILPASLQDPLQATMARMKRLQPGHVWLVGAGPGDPGLLTLQAASAIGQADVVLHDALVSPEVLALADPAARLEFAGKRGGRPSHSQADITERMIAFARQNKRVLRLKGGDPCLFGRGGEEAAALVKAGIPFRMLPGLTSGLVALHVASIPATMRGVSQALIFVTGRAGDGNEAIDWAALAATGQPIVLYMGLAELPNIAAALMAGGLPDDEPVAVIASATLPGQRILVTELARAAEDVRGSEIKAPAIIVIGAIVRLRAELEALALRVPDLVTE